MSHHDEKNKKKRYKVINKSKNNKESRIKEIPTRTEKLKLLSKKIMNYFLIALTIFGTLWGFYSYYSPRVSIGVSELLNPYSPFDNPFDVTNSGNIEIKKFHYDLKITKLSFNDWGAKFVFNNGSGIIKLFTGNVPVIKIGGHHPILINLKPDINFPGKSIKETEIFIRYNYSIPIFNISFCDSTKFVLFKYDENKYRWKEFQY
jgi:hypothetical protein